MTTSPISARLIKGGIVLMDPDTGVLQGIITLQYDTDRLECIKHTLQAI